MVTKQILSKNYKVEAIHLDTVLHLGAILPYLLPMFLILLVQFGKYWNNCFTVWESRSNQTDQDNVKTKHLTFTVKCCSILNFLWSRITSSLCSFSLLSDSSDSSPCETASGVWLIIPHRACFPFCKTRSCFLSNETHKGPITRRSGLCVCWQCWWRTPLLPLHSMPLVRGLWASRI